ncbi:hypothetical protein [Bosea sp. FBZP-16]|uniref:hypothetical protein n=1 Tax=Bosea sp. FBZP-16 TaxID=2065382 RepID=UPI000C316645|nr:hypothetical protein [Bosea sp. FBZP-16]
MARHGSLAEQLTALLAYRNRPEGPIEPMQSNWTVVPANDDIAVKSFSHERDLRVTPSVEEIMRQVETGDVEKNAKGQTVRIGNLRFSDGTQTEKAFKRTGGRSVKEVNFVMPVGAMLGCREQADRASGGKGYDGDYKRRSNQYFADTFGVDVPSKAKGKPRKNGPGFSKDELRAMRDEAFANTPVLPEVKRYPAGLPATRDLVSDHFIGMKVAATGQAGGAAWQDVSGAIVQREIWDAALSEMKGADLAVLDKAVRADSYAEVGIAAGQTSAYADKKGGGRRRLIAANDNLAASLKKHSA